MTLKRFFSFFVSVLLLISAIPLSVVAAADGSSAANAVSVSFGKEQTHSWTADNYRQKYYFKFTLPQAGLVSLKAAWPADSGGDIGDVLYSLHNASSGKQLWSTASYYADHAKDTFTFYIGLPAGSYYVSVQPDFKVLAGYIDYVYTVGYTENENAEREPNNTEQTATAMAFGIEYSASLGESDHGYDYWCYTADADFAGRLYLPEWKSLNQSGRECYLYHVNSDGDKQLLTDADVQKDSDGLSYYEVDTTKGTNIIYLSHYAGAPLPYSLRVTPPVPLNILKQPADLAVYDGEEAKVSVTASGKNLTYSWRVKDVTSKTFAKSSITTDTYSVTMNSTRDGRRIYCVITDAYGVSVKTKEVTLTMAKPFAIVTQPQNTTAPKGSYFSFYVKADGAGLKYQWYVANKGSSTFSKSSIKSANYAAVMSDTSDGRRAYCVITDSHGKTLTTKTVTATMSIPRITSQPTDGVAKVGSTASTVLTATGDGLKYQWYVKDPTATSFVKSSVTSRNYAFTMTAAKSGRKVYCIVTDKYGQTVQSNTVTLRMPQPKITKQPTDGVAKVGSTASTILTAEGDGLKYQWYVKDPTATSFVKSSVTSRNYAFTMTAAKSGRQVYCIVTDKYGQTVQSNTVTMRMPKPKFTVQPTDIAVPLGAEVSTFVKAEGESLTYQWYFKNADMNGFSQSSVTTSTYSYVMTDAKANRQVYCVITDKYGQTAKSATVTFTKIPKPTITKQPTAAKAPIGQTVSASVKATGEGLTYRWYFKNADMSGFSISSVTTATYSYEMTAAKAGRKAYCVITDKYGQTVTSQTVTFHVPNKPAITKQPTSRSAAIGSTVSTSVTATGEGLTYQWYFKNADMTAFSQSSVTTSTYSYEMTAAKAGRQVYCVITDQYGQTVKSVTVTFHRS